MFFFFIFVFWPYLTQPSGSVLGIIPDARGQNFVSHLQGWEQIPPPPMVEPVGSAV